MLDFKTVKANILLSQNAGNAISETLDVQNCPGGMPPHPPSRARASPSDDCYAVNRPPLFQNPGSAPDNIKFKGVSNHFLIILANSGNPIYPIFFLELSG